MPRLTVSLHKTLMYQSEPSVLIKLWLYVLYIIFNSESHMVWAKNEHWSENGWSISLGFDHDSYRLAQS